jgi:hypothetical protein
VQSRHEMHSASMAAVVECLRKEIPASALCQGL